MRAARQRSYIENAADQAVLAALRAAREQIKAGKDNWTDAAQQTGRNFFAANAREVSSASAQSAQIQISLNQGKLNGTIKYSVAVPTNFMKLAGLSKITLGGAASATISVAQFTDLHVLVDVSPSMGIGATAADQQIMIGSVGCTFSCHYTTNTGTNENFPAVKASGAKTRVDIAREAIIAALGKVPKDGMTRVALYTFSNSVKTIFPLSADISAAITAASNLELTNEVFQGGTNISHSLTQFGGMLNAAGSGLTSGSRRGIVVLATDAVQNSDILHFDHVSGTTQVMKDVFDPNFVFFPPTYDSTSFEKIQSMDAQACAAIKSKNYTMMTLETKYVVPTSGPDAGQPRYQFISNTLGPLAESNMKSCASTPGEYYLTNTATEIAAAIEKIFAGAIALKLTK